MEDKNKLKYTKEIINYYVRQNIITKEDLLTIMRDKKRFIAKNKSLNLKYQMLNNLYNCPFLLDLNYLDSETLKSAWLTFTYYRLGMELSELEYAKSNAIINEQEFNKNKKYILKNYFCTDRKIVKSL